MDIFLGLAEGGGAGEWGHGFDGEDNQSLRFNAVGWISVGAGRRRGRWPAYLSGAVF
jgi:hypothetical protein